jgi:hypothetical protein
MTQGESGFFTERNVSIRMSVDEDAEAMRELFGIMRNAVMADIDGYTGEKYDAKNNPEMAVLLGKTSLAIQEEFMPQTARGTRSPMNPDILQAMRVQRAYDIVTTIEIMNLSPYEAEDPKEAWERGLDIAATARFKQQLAKAETSPTHRQALAHFVLKSRRDSGQ